MSTITTINESDQPTNSRPVINTNFSNLNADKIETSVLDTDTTLAANSDAKIPSQKAVKAYVDTLGNVNASTTARGIVEEATSAEMIAGTATGGTGARLFINPSLVAETGADKIAKIKSTGKLDSSIIPSTTYGVGTTTKDISSTTSTTIAHGLGSSPVFVRIFGGNTVASSGTGTSMSVYNGTTQASVYSAGETSTGTAEASGNAFRFYGDIGGGSFNDGTITVDATNITIAWSKTGSPTGTAYLMWEAIK